MSNTRGPEGRQDGESPARTDGPLRRWWMRDDETIEIIRTALEGE